MNPACMGCGGSDIAPVGSLPTGAGKWGHFDLAGNVAEIVNDSDGLLTLPCVDCMHAISTAVHGAAVNPHLESNFLVPGGAWDEPPGGLRTSAYDTLRDSEVDDEVGFRCAR